MIESEPKPESNKKINIYQNDGDAREVVKYAQSILAIEQKNGMF